MGFLSKPKKPRATAQELAVTMRQTAALDKEVEEQEERLKAMARKKLGSVSLLGGAPRSRAEAATGSRGAKGAAAGAGRSMLGGVDAGPGYGGVSVAHPRILRQT
tara:strand:+ start:402 stop:716 length:315 start_codon:yes stop_codon:yes gene_type:complete